MRLFLTTLLCHITFSVFMGQTDLKKPITTIDDPDSLNGFEENTVRNNAIREGFHGAELKQKIYREKRKFVKDKFKIQSLPTQTHFTNKTLFVPFLNQDFELSVAGPVTQTNQPTGWFFSGDFNGNYPDNCNLQLCCPFPPTQGAIVDCPVANGYIDPSIGAVYPIYSVFGSVNNNGPSFIQQTPFQMKGTKIARLNNSINDNSVEKLSTTFSVTPNNSFLQLALLCVFATGHACCDGAMLRLNLIDANTNSLIACPNFSTSVSFIGCSTLIPIQFYDCGTGNPFSGGAAYIFNKWKIVSLDLTQQIGQNITVELLASDCPYGGHYGYAYVDASFGQMNINGNPIVNDTANVICCPGTTLNAPAGFASYQWIPPAGFAFPGASTVIASAPGIYTLNMTSPGYCSPVTKIVKVSFTNQIPVTSSSPIICNGGSATLTANGLLNYSWSDGSLTNTIVVSPTTSTTYSVSGNDGYGCLYNGYYTLVVTECTGIKELNPQQETFTVYPNPNNGEFVLYSRLLITKAEIIIENNLGQIIHSQPIYGGENRIKLKPLQAGIYYYRIKENKSILKKGTIKIE